MLRAEFRRPVVQRFGLIAVPVVISLLAGTWVGSRKLRKSMRLVALLLPVAGAPGSLWILRSTILAAYPKVPQVAALQGITLFEVAVLASWLLMAIVIWIAGRLTSR